LLKLKRILVNILTRQISDFFGGGRMVSVGVKYRIIETTDVISFIGFRGCKTCRADYFCIQRLIRRTTVGDDDYDYDYDYDDS